MTGPSTSTWQDQLRAELCPDEGGRLHKIGTTAQAVYLALRLHVYKPGGIAFPSVDAIATGLGLKRRAVQLALRKLESEGLIKCVAKGGGRPSKGQKPSAAKYQLTPLKGASPCAAKGASSDTKGRMAMHEKAHRDAPELEGIKTEAAGPDAAADVDLIRALTAAGVGEPKRSELARLPGLDARTVRNKAAWCREHGKGAGALIRELEAASEQATERARRKAEKLATSAPLAKPSPATVPEQSVSEADTCREQLAALPADELTRLVNQAIEANPTSGKAWRDRDPTKPADWGTPLVYAVMDQVQQQQKPKPTPDCTVSEQGELARSG